MTDAEPICFLTDATACGVRLDRLVAEKVEGISRSRVAALIKEGAIRVDGRVVKPSQVLAGGEQVVVTVPEARPVEAVAQAVHCLAMAEMLLQA